VRDGGLFPGHGFQPALHGEQLGVGLRVEGLGGQHRVALLDQVEGGTASIRTHVRILSTITDKRRTLSTGETKVTQVNSASR
jgi:hypothetical protein